MAEELFVVVAKTVPGTGGPDGNKFSNGQYVSLSSADGVSRPVVISEENTRAVIDTQSTHSTTQIFQVTYTAKRVDQAGSVRAKALVAGNTTYSTGSQGSPTPVIQSLNNQVANGQFIVTSPTREVGTKIELPVSDVFNLVKVVDSGSTSTLVTTAMLSATANNITNSYSLDTGQTDNYYGHSSISLKPGQQPPNGQICIIYDRLTHPSTGGFFTANSYDSVIAGSYNGGANTFTYASIPKYTSPVSGEEYRLSDVLDFRPLVATNLGTAAGTGTSAGAVSTTYDFATNTDALTAATILAPDSDTTTTLDYDYYLPRIDKLVLTRDRQFEVLKGKPNTNPVAPPDDEDSMTLYTLNIPAYTFALTDIETRYIDNKRFTMRDIGKIEKRVERLEYFTSLSILEKETEARDITSDGSRDSLFNTTGSRFKNGILVDPFAGHSIGDVTRDEYNSAVHFAEKQTSHRQNVDYLGRYIKRPPLAQSRLRHYDGKEVVFSYLDRKTNQRKLRTCDSFEFIELLTQHIPEKSFKMIRYYGFLSFRTRGKLLPIIYKLLGQVITEPKKIIYADLCKRFLCEDPFQCLVCGARIMVQKIQKRARLSKIMEHHEALATMQWIQKA